MQLGEYFGRLESDTGQRRLRARLAGPAHFEAQSATHELFRHLPPRSREERDTISERKGSS
jgi:hypothetical protein